MKKYVAVSIMNRCIKMNEKNHLHLAERTLSLSFFQIIYFINSGDMKCILESLL
jgi:hypothetical protein